MTTLVLRSLAWVFIVALVSILITSSQSRSADYWQACFEDSPMRCAYAASHHGVGSASHYLAEGYWRREQRARALSFYQRAVSQGDGGAAYAMARHVPAQSDQWMRAAAELGNREASLVVAAALMERAPAQAYQLLEPLEEGPQQQNMLALLLLRHPELSLENNWHQLAPRTPSWQRRREGAQWLAGDGDLSCSTPVSIHLVTTHKEVVFDWLGRLRQHPFAEFDFCFSLVAKPELNCEAGNGRAECDVAVPAPGSYQWIVTSQGSANARPGQLFIAAEADFSVLVHELAHWFGLADEYPMAEDVAAPFCSGRFRFHAQNIITTEGRSVSKDELDRIYQQLPWASHLQQSIAVFDGESFVLGSVDAGKVGLFPADACQNTRYQAWKPVAEKTFMEHHENHYIPPLYLELMQESEP